MMTLYLYFQELLVEYGLDEEDLVVVDDNPQVHPTQRLKLCLANVFFESSVSTLNESNCTGSSSHLFHNSSQSQTYSLNSPQTIQKWNPLKDSVVGFANTTKNRWGHHSASSAELGSSVASLFNNSSSFSADSSLAPPARRTSCGIDLLLSPERLASPVPCADSRSLPLRMSRLDIDGLISPPVSPDSTPALPSRRSSMGTIDNFDRPRRHVSLPAYPSVDCDSTPALPSRRSSAGVNVDRMRAPPPPNRRMHNTPANTPKSADEFGNRLVSPPAQPQPQRSSPNDTCSLSFVPGLGNDHQKQEEDKDESETSHEAFSFTSIPDVLELDEKASDDNYESDDYDNDNYDVYGYDESDEEQYSIDLSSCTNNDEDLSVETLDATPPGTPQRQQMTTNGCQKSILTSPKPTQSTLTTPTITIPEGEIPEFPITCSTTITSMPMIRSPLPSPRKLPKHTNSFELNKRKYNRRGAIICRTSIVEAALEASLTLALDLIHDNDNKSNNSDNEEEDSFNPCHYESLLTTIRGAHNKQSGRIQVEDEDESSATGLHSNLNLNPSQLERLRLFQEALRAVDDDQTSTSKGINDDAVRVGTQKMVAEQELSIDL